MSIIFNKKNNIAIVTDFDTSLYNFVAHSKKYELQLRLLISIGIK